MKWRYDSGWGEALAFMQLLGWAYFLWAIRVSLKTTIPAPAPGVDPAADVKHGNFDIFWFLPDLSAVYAPKVAPCR